MVERKNTAIGKLEEAFNFLKDNHLDLTIIKDGDIKIMSVHNKIKVAVIGATGYTGLDLIFLLSSTQGLRLQNYVLLEI